ncbi:MAG: bifunctional phosphoribosyl-AMP cyclohydrolase/phosphoribosyl-ATP diphosphatase HisIE [Lachnospiraceae bacterium]|nr:bifunctional phosphoribosyl-AMP cyclohydrolase/phosphoribosyl-ATP diphosphatase HisIE [Lachnospiraceae bacterium]
MKEIIVKIEKEKFKDKLFDRVEELSALGADGFFICSTVTDDEGHNAFLEEIREIVKELDVKVYLGTKALRFEDIKKALYTGAEKFVVPCQSALKADKALEEGIDRFGEKRVIEIKEEQLFEGNLSEREKIAKLLQGENEFVVIDEAVVLKESLHVIKKDLLDLGIEMNTFLAAPDFKSLKKDDKGLVTAVVKDFKSGEVLMVAYMNEESYNLTLATGRMTYYSRSRKKIWLKGETTGHFQYVKELRMDCDGDALLATVRQIGNACHTGNYSCFYTQIAKASGRTIKENTDKILTEVYNTILDRKLNPKEGSYTNYLFDKGIDKILKKCGEEATEIVIAAKNPDKEDLKYEIADFLYHVSVLMVERNLSWNDVFDELANRH